MDTKKHIIIADNDVDNLNFISSKLKNLGFECLYFSKGLLLLISAQSSPPDLIILDYLLSDLSAITVINILKNDYRTKDIPIILFVPESSLLGTSPQLQMGVDAIVRKPFIWEDLVAIICKLLGVF